MVFQRHGIGHVTGFTRYGPCLHQVLVLTGVDIIQHAVGPECFVAVFRAGDIGGGVQVAAIFFTDDDAHRIAFFIFVFIKIDNNRAFAVDGQTFGLQVGNDARQHAVVQAFTHHIVFGQGDVQTIVG
ncbi:hypothetical protein SRABI106_03851 [Rahnella aquatilis]|nr:hypothetical protein SRABI106_03851 [Rahnella aquatilis]